MKGMCQGSCRGSCLCGAVAYEVAAPDLKIGHCSCRTCRKAHAAPIAATARVPRERFRFLRGEDRLTAFESSPGKLRRFCSACGSHEVPWCGYEGEIRDFAEGLPGR